MSLIGFAAAGGILAAAIWYGYRRRAAPGKRLQRDPPTTGAARLQPALIDLAKLEALNSELNERLWRMAYTASGDTQFTEPADVRTRDAVIALLKSDQLDPKYFPRRPALMPQLLRAVDDPTAASDRIARMVAHDPVLAADVLQLANTSLYRTTSLPIETIQRAVVVLGVDALRYVVATAMLQPVFRATRNNFPRFPRMLWGRTERAARAAEWYAMQTRPQDRFEAQLVILLSALGPLVVYGTALDVSAQRAQLAPSPALFVVLTSAMGAPMALRVARHWETSPRLLAALSRSAGEPLTEALCMGELLGTLSMLESQSAISTAAAFECARAAGLTEQAIAEIWPRLAGAAPAANM